MATYWHPLLAQFLRDDYGDRLEVKDSVKIGKMPLELDILIFPSVPHTIPLLIVYKGVKQREKEIIRFFIEHYQELRKYSHFFSTIHTKRLKEVLEEMDLRNLRGLDLDIPAIIDLLGKERLIETIGLDNMIETVGLDKVVKTAGQEKVIETIGWEKALEIILSNLTKEQIKKLIEQNGNR